MDKPFSRYNLIFLHDQQEFVTYTLFDDGVPVNEFDTLQEAIDEIVRFGGDVDRFSVNKTTWAIDDDNELGDIIETYQVYPKM